MAKAEFVGNGAVLQDSTVNEANPFTEAFTMLGEADTDRVLVIPFMIGKNAGIGPTTGTPPIPVTYGGVAMTVHARERSEQITFGVAILAVEGQSFTGTDIVIDPGENNGSTVEVTAQPFVFKNVDQAAVNFDLVQSDDVSAASVTLDAVAVPSEGDLVFSFAVKRSLSAGLAFSTDDEASYTLEGALDTGDFTASNFCSGSAGRSAYSVSVSGDQAVTWTQGSSTSMGALAFALPQTAISYNCECDEEDIELETLAALRKRWLIRMGYAAQADNPPPGMADLADDFIADAQRILYRRFPALRKERFFSWTMTAGTRFYGIRDNEDECTKKLDPYRLSWVGIEDLNGDWYELREGILPEFYTDVTNQTWPTRYEIRQCIEVFPAPAGAYKLRIKGDFGVLPLTDDADKTTIPSSPVFHWALGMGKAHYQKPDAQSYFDIALKEIGDYVSGGHGTRRYVPQPGRSVPPPPKPVMKGGFE